MGDYGDVGRAISDDRKARHADWKRENTAEIKTSGIPHTSANNGEALLFREPGKPRADFYPSTGRWRVAGVQKTMRGGAQAFLGWYAKQTQKERVDDRAKGPR